MASAIIGLGTASPVHRIPQESGVQVVGVKSCIDSKQIRKVEAIYRRTGVSTRGSVLLDNPTTMSFYPAATDSDFRGPTTQRRSERFMEEAPRLAIGSAFQALHHAKIDPHDITHLVTVTCTGFCAPGIDISLIDELGLPATTQRIQVGFMGCHGAINGLRAAKGLVAQDQNANVLMCSVELCSLHYQYGFTADRIVSGALFADGSASAILAHSERNSSMGTLLATGSKLVPNCRDEMTWKIGDFGYEMTLSAKVPLIIEESLNSFLEVWLSQQGLQATDVGGWAVHPGGARILRAVENAMSLKSDALAISRQVLAEHGNMSSATMLFIINRFVEMKLPKPWLMLGFGPGLEIEVALIK